MATRTMAVEAGLVLLFAAVEACDSGGAEAGPEDAAGAGALDVPDAGADPGVEPDEPPENHAPSAVNDLVTISAGGSATIGALFNDFDPDGDLLAVVEVTQGAHGVVEVLYQGAQLRYTAVEPPFVGLDDFEYTVSDGRGGLDTAVVTVHCVSPPALAITSPAEGAVVSGDAVTVTFEVTGCNFTAPGQDAGGCHAHKVLDGAWWAPPAGGGIGQYQPAPFDVGPLAPGPHTIGLVLAKNDGTDALWNPEVFDTVSVEVE